MLFGLRVDDTLFAIGTPKNLIPFFSNICVHLENGKQGSRFPVIMNELYWGEVSYEHVSQAMEEIKVIEQELKRVPVAKYVYDFLEPETKAPEGLKKNESADNLLDYIVNLDGKTIASVFSRALYDAYYSKKNIKLGNLIED